MKLFLLLLFSIVLNAKMVEAYYDVRYGLFGKVGESKAKLEQNATDYKIEVEAKATGFAKVLSGGRVERYESVGVVKDGLLVPKIYKKMRKSKTKKDIKIFIFDYKNRVIKVHREIYRKNTLESVEDKNLSYFVENDVLTLYFNIKKLLKPGKYNYRFYAVGGRRKDGRIDVIVPKDKRSVKELLKVDGFYLIVKIYQKIFASKEGELILAMDEEGITKKALLKDVIMFGDIVGVLKKKVVK